MSTGGSSGSSTMGTQGSTSGSATGRSGSTTGTASGSTGGSSSTTSGTAGTTGGAAGTTSGSASTGGAAGATTGSINLTTEQRTQVTQAFRTINVQPVTETFAVSVGATVPGTVTLNDCPDAVERLLTGLPECKFVIVKDQIVIVEPRQKRVVTVIERRS